MPRCSSQLGTSPASGAPSPPANPTSCEHRMAPYNRQQTTHLPWSHIHPTLMHLFHQSNVTCICRHPGLSEQRFHQLADGLLDRLQERMEEFVEGLDLPDADVEYSVGSGAGSWPGGSCCSLSTYDVMF